MVFERCSRCRRRTLRKSSRKHVASTSRRFSRLRIFVFGGGITVLQIILETVTGKDFPSLIKELVLEPLEMTHSVYSLPDGEINVAKAHFTGYTACDVQWHIQPEKAAAGLWTTPTDLLKAVRAMQRLVDHCKAVSQNHFWRKR
jgi:hypothetical protein